MEEINQVENPFAKTETHSNLLAVFVVQFDVHKGNVVEWQYPPDFDLEGIEYQAICSGLHRIKSDIIYFSRQTLYGMSAFENMPTTDVERGAHMKAIGILVQPTKHTGLCGQVWTHRVFLQQELRNHMKITQEQGRYDRLQQYYTHHQLGENQQQLFSSMFNFPQLNHHSVNYNLRYNVAKDLFNKEETFGVDAFTDFVTKFGSDVFVLWKAALLRKRIVIINTPPMEIACKYVYNIHLLGKVPEQFEKNDLIPKFTVGVNEIPHLEKRNQSYVACTPDSIFQMKSDLYDLLITIPSFHPTTQQRHDIALSDLTNSHAQFKSTTLPTQHNPADFTRFSILWKQLLSISSSSWSEYVASEPKDPWNTSAALITGFYYWLYEETPETSASNWKDLFGGRRRRNSSEIFLNDTTADESQMLLVQDEQDATEIDNSEVFEVVAARASNEQTQHVNVSAKQDNETLLGFFHSLTYYLLSTLQTILSMNEQEGCHNIDLYPKDLVQLGLDPQTDVGFVTEVAQLYFKKQVTIHGLHHAVCCCQPQRNIHI